MLNLLYQVTKNWKSNSLLIGLFLTISPIQIISFKFNDLINVALNSANHPSYVIMFEFFTQIK